MPNKAALRRILADLTDNNAGLGWAARQPGEAVSGNEAPVLVAEDSGDLLRHLEVREQGDAATGVKVQPVMTCLDPNGDLQYLNCEVDGSLIISTESPGTQKSESDSALPTQPQVAGLTEIDVVTVSLSNSMTVKNPEMLVSSAQDVLWRLVWLDDAAETELARVLTEVGDNASEPKIKLADFVTPATGTQVLRVVGTQQRGPASDMHAVAAALESA